MPIAGFVAATRSIGRLASASAAQPGKSSSTYPHVLTLLEDRAKCFPFGFVYDRVHPMNDANHLGPVNSVFVSWHGDHGGTQAARIAQALGPLGRFSQVHPGLWYLETGLSARDVNSKVSQVLQADESLAVIDATNHEAAWRNIDPATAECIRQNWHNGAVPSSRRTAAPMQDRRG